MAARLGEYSQIGLVNTLNLPGTATSATVTGLKAGTGCSFSVRGRNALGTSAESSRSNTVYPHADRLSSRPD